MKLRRDVTTSELQLDATYVIDFIGLPSGTFEWVNSHVRKFHLLRLRVHVYADAARLILSWLAMESLRKRQVQTASIATAVAVKTNLIQRLEWPWSVMTTLLETWRVRSCVLLSPDPWELNSSFLLQGHFLLPEVFRQRYGPELGTLVFGIDREDNAICLYLGIGDGGDHFIPRESLRMIKTYYNTPNNGLLELIYIGYIIFYLSLWDRNGEINVR
ncbi:hypothetical protein PIB30_003905 [Stylosanthes scabra]|uniref:Uncharacterized protein n=1 Tax=Stylosanthes scabra TaxID=79078 RepID=A0ABU6U576_9FABA|nr:hypothetical protein [Stylosanthes scabra]